MNSDLQQAIAGEPVTVTLGGKTYPIAFPVQAVILYQRETALIDKRRRQDSLNAGGQRLTRDEIKELRKRRRALLAEIQALRPAGEESWSAEALESVNVIAEESMEIKCALDEDAAAGDSLYDLYNWRKIAPEKDPERFLLALWVGLHRFVESWAVAPKSAAPTRYQSPLTREELGPLIHVGNAEELTMAIAKALAAHITAPEEAEAEPLPNAPPPAAPAETTRTTTGPNP